MGLSMLQHRFGGFLDCIRMRNIFRYREIRAAVVYDPQLSTAEFRQLLDASAVCVPKNQIMIFLVNLGDLPNRSLDFQLLPCK